MFNVAQSCTQGVALRFCLTLCETSCINLV